MAIHSCSLGAPILLEEPKAAGVTPTRQTFAATPACDAMGAIGQRNTAWDPFLAARNRARRYGSNMEAQSKVSLCSQQVYATASPAREVAFMIEHGRRNDTHVPYPGVASFCDVALIFRNSEVCRAAYRYSQPKSDPAR
jgi:hypothetical protein